MPRKLPLQTLPHSVDAEKTVIGALLLDPDAIYKIDESLHPSDFYDPVHQAIYQAIRDLNTEGNKIDFVTVSSKLKDHSKLQQIGGSAFLAELGAQVPTSSHIQQYADIVRGKSKLRHIIATGQYIIGLGYDQKTPVSNLMESVEQKLLELTAASSDPNVIPLSSLNSSRYEHYAMLHTADDPTLYYGIRTGFTDLDDKIQGLQPGDVMIVGGATSRGKTALALDIAHRVAFDQKKRVAIFSLEQTEDQIYDRIFAATGRVEESKLTGGRLNDDDFSKLGQALDAVNAAHLFVDDDAYALLPNLRSKARRLKAEQGLDLLIIDYIQLIQVPDELTQLNRTQQLGYISKAIKMLARQLACPIIVTSQLSRNVSNRTDKAPHTSDIRDSGEIEQDADYVVLLQRKELDVSDPNDCDEPGITDVYLRKNRPHGTTGHFKLRFDVTTNRYQPVDTLHESPVVEQPKLSVAAA